ncbi:hypothetical protein OC498_13175 [Acinetobacter bohemicus]|uniref:hypothetical protein n=1 Tax=Acinetobacter TaxID=469 RepID=UPI00209AA91A|nr:MULTISPECIES: hypothetical protein [Acinetobacter]MCO8043460.1 hypothetical protein [Acinetobacter sp. S4400-12]MCU7225832.1 hypothetical protein [Acinetobacter bohemicus]
MPNIQGQKKWSEVRLLETHELARGGVNGNLNEQAIALADRTEFLNQEKANKSEIVQGVFEFGTYAEFNAAKANLPLNCTVVIGEENNSGSGSWGVGNNRWNGSILAKSSFDPYEKSRSYTNEKTRELNDKLRSVDSKGSTHIFVDANENIVAYLNVDGDLVLIGLDLPVQQEIKKLDKKADEIKLFAKTEIASAVDEISSKTKSLDSNSGLDTHTFIDANENVVAAIKEDGSLVLTGLDKPVQQEISTLKESTQTDENSASHMILDKDQNVIAYFDQESKLHLAGMAESVQDAFLNQKAKTDSKKTIHDFYTIDAMNFVNNRTVNNLETAPIPYPLLPQPFKLGQTWQNNLVLPVSTEQIHIAGFNGNRWSESIGVCHPYLIRFDAPFHGYKYWCCITPYTSSVEDYEIPWMYGSNDDELKDWHLIGGGVPMPIDVDPSTAGTEYISGHLSDNGMTYNPMRGELVIYWRKSLRRTSVDIDDQILYRTTKNGSEWSEIKQLHPIRTRLQNSMLSPSIIFDPKTGLFHLYTVGMYKADGNYHAIQHQTSYDMENWSEVEYLRQYNELRPWHLEVKWVGDAQVMLLHLESNATADKLLVGVAKNFTDFSFNTNLFTEGVDIYKSTFLPVFEGDKISLKVFYTTDEFTSPNWQAHVTQTNFTNYGV